MRGPYPRERLPGVQSLQCDHSRHSDSGRVWGGEAGGRGMLRSLPDSHRDPGSMALRKPTLQDLATLASLLATLPPWLHPRLGLVFKNLFQLKLEITLSSWRVIFFLFCHELEGKRGG